AVYSGAPVLLLDEATSALDAACEERMIRRLRELPDRTVLMATHRGRAVALCDRVVQVGGRVSTEGCPNLERRKSL
ncbi:MAG: ABC transporter ATP-binding protein, partial [Eggerthella lenta]